MKRIIQKQNKPIFNNSIENLQSETKNWLSEIEYIKVEQEFLKELITDHIIGLCKSDNFSNAKLLLNGINHESKLGEILIASIKEHRINLALLIENIYLKKEDDFRKDQKLLKIEVDNYIQNFRYLKEQVFELVLFIMKNEKQHRLLAE
ncbi:hypothetical protein [Lutibacter flavus]|uniref:Uncharacterized protein n=1 Tax=Lutibacter flavus TaxID=691689 RepID=A0A238VN45_9FLAO|nr:hypothetical protein [Lutibacter flavus]SNR35601.1 hypothetical protein SAMN04488111_0742 [Lutibacter flavus]